MKFKNLTKGEKDHIKLWFNTAPTKWDAYEHLVAKFGVSERTIRKWASKLGCTREYNLKGVANIKVNDAVVLQAKQKSPAKILLYDIETAPLLSYVWGTWQQNIGHNMSMLQEDWFILTWSAKWLFEDGVFSDRLTPEQVKNQDDESIVKSLWKLIDEADIVIAHNGKKFDNKRINTRFLKHGIVQPMPYQVIDTLEIARKYLAVSSNKLDYLGEFLGVGRKLSTGGFELWKRCMNGEEAALIEMEEYNRGDVVLLEDVYLKLRPFIKPHPNMGLFITENEHSCPSCGHTELERGGTYTTSVNIYEAFRCLNCGSVGRSRKSSIPVGSKSNLLTPTAR